MDSTLGVVPKIWTQALQRAVKISWTVAGVFSATSRSAIREVLSEDFFDKRILLIQTL
jgi:hypothetical protein